MATPYETLVEHLREIQTLRSIGAVLGWDQQTQMPPGGAETRANQGALVARMSHEMFTDDRTGELLEAAADKVDAGYDSTSASMVRVVKEDYEEARKLPAKFVAELSRETTLGHEIWAEARAEKNFSKFQLQLEKLVELTRQMAEYLGYEDHPYDALLNQYERGATTARVREIFDNHRPALVELISAIADKPQVDHSFLHQEIDIDQQKAFGLDVVKAFGFDFKRGIQAVAVHPFCTSFSVNDVRITTRFDPTFMPMSLYGMMHEAGHGMYEQGIAQELDGTPLASGTSLGVHESQSRMWENIVGRSRAFWTWALPRLQQAMPGKFDNVTVDQMYRAVNKVERSFIRVEADEATYNLHIILRFELEQDIVAGKLKVADLPEAWNAKFTDYFGITPPDVAMGVLQDVHWSAGLMGYFPTYALGNLLSVQYYNQALKAHPSIPDEIAEGKFDALLGWLNANIHQYGRKLTGEELTKQVTGEEMQSRDYIAYLQQKYGEVYGL